MAKNTTSSLDKLTCTNYVDFGKWWSRFGWLSRSKNDSNYLDVKLNVFKKDDSKEFRLVQNLTTGETDFNQVLWFRNQLVIAAENSAREEKLTPVLMPTRSKDLDEQLKLAHNGWRSKPSKQKDFCDSCAVQCGQALEFQRSSPHIRKEEGGREFSTSCLCEL